MKIIESGYNYKIYDDGLTIHNQLPAASYTVSFDKMTGWSLNKYSNIEIKEKIYGVHQKKVDKVMNAFKQFNRNLGVILSGDKGIGKSLFSKMLGKTAIEQGYPLIIVENYIPHIASFLQSIEQEVVVLFDEFDKTFTCKDEDDEPSTRAEMLTLFDGISQGKKLFIVTCNDLYNINQFLINRPGRFHYHFRFNYPTEEEIREYMTDKVKPEYASEVNHVVAFARKINLNYDCLRAIAFELNQCGNFEEAISDLNIIRTFGEDYQVIAVLDNGEKFVASYNIDLWDSEPFTITMENQEGYNVYNITVSAADAVYSDLHRAYVIPEKDISYNLVSYVKGYKNSDDPKDIAFYNKYSNAKVKELILKKDMGKDYHYRISI